MMKKVQFFHFNYSFYSKYQVSIGTDITLILGRCLGSNTFIIDSEQIIRSYD